MQHACQTQGGQTYLITPQGIILATNVGFDPQELEQLTEQIKGLPGLDT